MMNIRKKVLSDVPRFREMPLVPTPKKGARADASGFFVSLLPKPQEALEETVKMIGFLERFNGLVA